MTGEWTRRLGRGLALGVFLSPGRRRHHQQTRHIMAAEPLTEHGYIAKSRLLDGLAVVTRDL